MGCSNNLDQDRSPLEVFDATVDQLTQHGLMVSRADSLCFNGVHGPWLPENWIPKAQQIWMVDQC